MPNYSKFKKWEFWNRVLIVTQTVAFVIAGLGVFFAFISYQHQKTLNSADAILKLDDRLNDSRYDEIHDAINNNNGNYPLLADRGGRFSCNDITEFIGNYDTIGYLYDDSLISRDMAYDMFADNVEKAYCNKDVMSCVNALRAKDKVKEKKLMHFIGFTTLAEAFFGIDKQKCSDIDLQ